MLVWGKPQDDVLWGRIWLYGKPGSGKTVAAAYFPQPFFVFCHNENSKTTLRPMQGQFRYVTIGVPQPQQKHDAVVPVRADMEQLLDALLEADARGALHQEFGATVIIDSMTHYNDLVISELAAGNKRRRMEQQEWGLLRSHYLHLRDVLWRLRAHVVFTSFDFVKTDAAGSVIKGGPYLQGSAAELLPGSCDALGYLETDALCGARQVWFSQRGPFPARHRYPGVSEGPIPNHQLWSTIAPALGHAQ